MRVTDTKPDRFPIILALTLFFVSGALALVYELVWTRMMMHVFGSTALAVGTVLAAFMAGMAMGAWYFGKRADQTPNCLRLYALLEIGIAATALLSHVLLDQLAPAHRAIFELTGSSQVIFPIVRFLLAFTIVMAPTLLMGATLPVLARHLENVRSLAGINLSSLYAANTFGAVCGVLLTGFYLIGAYGIHLPAYLAMAGNLLIGLIALAVSGQARVTTTPDHAVAVSNGGDLNDEISGSERNLKRIILLGLGLSGFTSFAYEIYWTRSLIFILGNSTYALTTMLSAFLTGIALGGYLVRFILKRGLDRPLAFGCVQVFLGILSAMALPLLFSFADPQSLNDYLLGSSGHPVRLVFSGFGIAFVVMLLPATLIGATFPLVGAIAIRDERKTGSTVGKVYSVNTLGNVAGALLPGLLLLRWLGIQKGILTLAIINVSLGFIVIYQRITQKQKNRYTRITVPVFMLFAVVLLSRAPLQFQFPSDGERDYFETLFYREGPLATTKVYVNPDNSEKHISVDGIVIGGTGYSEFKQLLLAHLPKLLLDEVSSELSVGVGSGILLGESALHTRVKKITGVEIEPSVIDGAAWFASENHEALENRKIQIVVDDIGSFLRTRSGQYQVISADEKTADEYASNGFSYSLDYYKLMRDHLAPGGLAIQWVPTTLPPELYRMVLKTFSESFERVQLWYFLPAHKRGPFNSILIGSNEPVPIRLDLLRDRFSRSGTALSSLKPYGLTSADAVIPHYVAGESIIRKAVADSPVNSLDYPRYEFYRPWDFARDRDTQFIANHELILEMKIAAFPAFLASQDLDTRDTLKLRQSIAAELRYLSGFQKFLEGMTLEEQYRVFDNALAMAPWNDSLRARIYAQYKFIASTRRDPAARARLFKRANDLYAGRAEKP